MGNKVTKQDEMEKFYQSVFYLDSSNYKLFYEVSFWKGSVIVSTTKMSSASAPEFPVPLDPLVSIFLAFDSGGNNLITVLTISGTFEVGKIT